MILILAPKTPVLTQGEESWAFSAGLCFPQEVWGKGKRPHSVLIPQGTGHLLLLVLLPRWAHLT